MSSRARPIGIVLLGSVLGCSAGHESLGDSGARDALESQWNQPIVGLLLGNVRFVAGQGESAKGRDKLSELPLYRAFASKGLITISDERDLTQNFGGWNDWFQLTQDGVRRTATIVVTDRGRSQGTVKHIGDFDELWLNVSRTKIDAIVANDTLSIAADRYRVIQGTRTVDLPDDLVPALDSARGATIREGRFKALLKLDPFDKRWKLVAQDLSKRSELFVTSIVDQCIGLLRSGVGTCD